MAKHSHIVRALQGARSSFQDSLPELEARALLEGSANYIDP